MLLRLGLEASGVSGRVRSLERGSCLPDRPTNQDDEQQAHEAPDGRPDDGGQICSYAATVVVPSRVRWDQGPCWDNRRGRCDNGDDYRTIGEGGRGRCGYEGCGYERCVGLDLCRGRRGRRGSGTGRKERRRWEGCCYRNLEDHLRLDGLDLLA